MKGYKDKKELAFIKEDGKQYTVAAVAVDPSGKAGPLVKIPIKLFLSMSLDGDKTQTKVGRLRLETSHFCILVAWTI